MHSRPVEAHNILDKAFICGIQILQGDTQVGSTSGANYSKLIRYLSLHRKMGFELYLDVHISPGWPSNIRQITTQLLKGIIQLTRWCP